MLMADFICTNEECDHKDERFSRALIKKSDVKDIVCFYCQQPAQEIESKEPETTKPVCTTPVVRGFNPRRGLPRGFGRGFDDFQKDYENGDLFEE